MKRCPECEFLYEDDQSLCDMDGKPLRNTGQLLPLPGNPSPPRSRSRWGGAMIPLLAGLVLSAVLFILYHASPHTFSSSAGSQPANPASKPKAGKDTKLPIHQPGPNATSNSPASTQPGADPFARPGTQPNAPGEKPKPESPAPGSDQKVPSEKPANENRVAPEPQPVKPVVSEEKPEATQKTSTTAPPKAVSNQPARAAASPARKPAAQNNDESKLNSILKKTGRILKKPFKL